MNTQNCPRCDHTIAYFDLPWTTVTGPDGKPVARRIGQCPHCKQWLRAVLYDSDTTHAGGWGLEPVDPAEIAQVEKPI